MIDYIKRLKLYEASKINLATDVHMYRQICCLCGLFQMLYFSYAERIKNNR
jgi:hypothetical protein